MLRKQPPQQRQPAKITAGPRTGEACAWLQGSGPASWGTGRERAALGMSEHHPISGTLDSLSRP